MARTAHFCTQFLLTGRCDREDTCLFYHVNKVDLQLYEPIPNGSSFVKGKFREHPELTINKKSPANRRCAKNTLAGCNYQQLGLKCPYESDCIYTANSHNSSRETMDRDNAKPSTSASTPRSRPQCASTSNTTEIEDESWQGATALPRSYHLPHSKTYDHKLHHRRNKKLNIDAPEFVPRTRFNATSNAKRRICPYAERNGLCKYPTGECTYLHGDMCDLCARPALHPHNEDLRKKHTQECIKRHERDMEIAFAVARSKEKVCGICFEVVMQKSTEEQRFGILPSCNHCFCLACIRRWRQSKQFENKIIRSCPECRIASDFVCPSAYWVDTKEDKDKVIEKYKLALSKKDCKYFKYGRGHCPFGNKCFYRHCLQNGRKIDVGPPPSGNNANHPETFEIPAGVELIQRLLMLEHLQEVCPLDDLPDEMDIDEILQIIDMTEMFFSDTDTDYWSD